jgi:hypothetical protein
MVTPQPELKGRVRSRCTRKAKRRRLQPLAAPLDTDWLRVVSRLPIENCPKQAAGPSEMPGFNVLVSCQHRWEELQATLNRDVRRCDDCQRDVHYCDTIVKARELIGNGQCVAVDVGVIRGKDDLAPPPSLFGVSGPRQYQMYLRREAQRLAVDEVSAAREATKLRNT